MASDVIGLGRMAIMLGRSAQASRKGSNFLITIIGKIRERISGHNSETAETVSTIVTGLYGKGVSDAVVLFLGYVMIM